jgi:hypothetical protein
MIFFIAFVALLVGYPVYVMIDMQLSGGVKRLSSGYMDVDLKAMSTFTFDQNNGTIDDIPQKWRDLDGKKVVVHGEMWAADDAGDAGGRNAGARARPAGVGSRATCRQASRGDMRTAG